MFYILYLTDRIILAFVILHITRQLVVWQSCLSYWWRLVHLLALGYASCSTRNSSICPPGAIDPTTHRTMSERSTRGYFKGNTVFIYCSIQNIIQPVLHGWCTKGYCVCYALCDVVYIKEHLLLIGKSSPCMAIAGFLSRNLSGRLS